MKLKIVLLIIGIVMLSGCTATPEQKKIGLPATIGRFTDSELKVTCWYIQLYGISCLPNNSLTKEK